jgi:hypothetical protein
MQRNLRYIMLISSLPHLPAVLTAKEPPISRLKLDQRLTMLKEDDAQVLHRIEAVLTKEHLSLEHTDAAIVHSVERLMVELESEPSTLRRIVDAHYEIYTLIAALRRRHRGEGAPLAAQPWGYAPFLAHIARNWTEPGFQLHQAFPWILDAHRLLEAQDTIGLERLLLGILWTNLDRRIEGHYFDLEAVVGYVLRWDLIARWTASDRPSAANRFHRLEEDGLAPYNPFSA